MKMMMMAFEYYNQCTLREGENADDDGNDEVIISISFFFTSISANKNRRRMTSMVG